MSWPRHTAETSHLTEGPFRVIQHSPFLYHGLRKKPSPAFRAVTPSFLTPLQLLYACHCNPGSCWWQFKHLCPRCLVSGLHLPITSAAFGTGVAFWPLCRNFPHLCLLLLRSPSTSFLSSARRLLPLTDLCDSNILSQRTLSSLLLTLTSLLLFQSVFPTTNYTVPWIC